ncbi:cytochrome P450 [Biscogniauxia marginata]|nr:cytochrome P450 [Biscogniauxia marginata]
MDSNGSLLTWRSVVVVVVAYYGTLVFYRLFLHPLARFPGPRLAAISRWCEGYYDVVQDGKYTSKIAELHKIYGLIIRISPYELHVIDPAFFDTLYRMDGRWDKYAWTYDAFGAKSSTIFGSGIASTAISREKTFERIFEEFATVTGAAFETTANVLRLILYHVFSNDEILQRLRKEISEAAAESFESIQLKALEQLPYLTSTLMEGMRLSPAIGTRAARVTDKDLFYGDWRIPAGTPVGMTTLLMHTEKLYPDPMCFNPDRWMDPTARKAGEKIFAPFSRGTRIYLGMHLAWAEMYLFLAALVQSFNFEIKDATAEDFEFERDNFGIGTKAQCNLIARITPYEG